MALRVIEDMYGHIHVKDGDQTIWRCSCFGIWREKVEDLVAAVQLHTTERLEQHTAIG